MSDYSDYREKQNRVVQLCHEEECITCPCGPKKGDCCTTISCATEEQLDKMLDAFGEKEASAEPKAPKILDSGERTEYSTGAVRDCKEGKGRCDLMPLDVLELLLTDPLRNLGLCIKYISLFQESGDARNWLRSAIIAFGSERGWKNPSEMLLEVAKHFEEGAKKYGPNNWQKGIPVHSYIDSAVRHYLKYRAGWTDEPHDRAFVWNLMCCIWTMEHHPELDDFTEKGKKDNE